MMALGLLMFGLADMQAQTVDISGSCNDLFYGGIFTLQADVNGRPSFEGPAGNIIAWSGTRWEHHRGVLLASFNTLDTPTPPASSLQAWTAAACSPGTVMGSGTTMPSTASIPSIPTLSEWGLIVLALLFMTFGTLYILQGEGRIEVKEIG